MDDEDDENATVIATSKTKRLLPGKPDASASTRPAPVGAFVNPRDERDANHAAKRARVARNEAPRGAPAPEPLSGDHPPAADIASRPSALTAADEGARATRRARLRVRFPLPARDGRVRNGSRRVRGFRSRVGRPVREPPG